MTLLEQIEVDLKDALKSRNEIKISTLRMVKADILYEDKKSSDELDEAMVLEVIMRSAKKRKEAASEFRNAGRADRADVELAELDIINTYLPKQLSGEKISLLIDKKINELGEVTQKDFGKIMGPLMKELKGTVDGSLVQELLKKKLENR